MDRGPGFGGGTWGHERHCIRQGSPIPPQIPNHLCRFSDYYCIFLLLKVKKMAEVRRKGSKVARRPAETDGARNTNASVKYPALPGSRTDGAEMKDLMLAPVAESESKLFHTAQTIAQQRLLVTDGVISGSPRRRPVIIFDRYEFSALCPLPYSHDYPWFVLAFQ